MLIVVRHARPIADPARPAAEWPLSEEGEADATALGRLLRAWAPQPHIVSSPEVKALATAGRCFPGHTVVPDDRLAEAGKPWFDQVDELHRATAAYLAGEPLTGWESAEAVAERFDLCLSEPGQAGDLVAFTHGTALAVWLHRRRRLSEPFQWWRSLLVPDAWVVGSAGEEPVRISGPGPSAPRSR